MKKYLQSIPSKLETIANYKGKKSLITATIAVLPGIIIAILA